MINRESREGSTQDPGLPARMTMQDMKRRGQQGGRVSSLPDDPAPERGNARFEFRSQQQGDTYLFELRFTPNIRLVPIVRRFVSDFYREVFEDEEAISRMALVTHELMENAVQHSSGGEAHLLVEMRGLESGRSIVVRIGNPT